jgi:hypothetical protein
MKKDLTNQKFSKLLVLSVHSKTRNSHIRYTCKCDCGNNVNILGTHLIQGNTKSCGCDKPVGKTHHQWTGVGEMSGDFWDHHIKRSASGVKGKRGPIELSVTKEDVWNLFLKQNRKCALSGLDLSFPTVSKDKSWTASLDRIDSSKGYIEGNIQWVHKDINMMKRTYDNQHFINMCKLIANKM